MRCANLPNDTTFDERERFLVSMEQNLVTTLGMFDDIRRECKRAGDHVAANFMAAASESLIAFANVYFRNLS